MDNPPYLRDADPDADCSAELEALIHKCIDRNREVRPSSARELLAQLKSIWRLETDESYGTETSLAPHELGEIGSPSVTPMPDGVPLEDPSVVGAIPSTVKLDALPAPLPRWIWSVAVVLFVAAGLTVGTFLGSREGPSEAITIPAAPPAARVAPVVIEEPLKAPPPEEPEPKDSKDPDTSTILTEFVRRSRRFPAGAPVVFLT